MPAHPHQIHGIFDSIIHWRKPLTAFLLAVALLSTGIAFFLPNEYKSTTVFYPTDLNSINPEQMVSGSRRDPELFGTSEDIDRVLTIAYSQPLAEHIIRKFDLAKHYDLDTTEEVNRQYVVDEFLQNFEAEHTERDAIAVTFYDQDKNLAAAVANEVTAHLDLLNQQLTLENRKKVLSIFDERFKYLEKEYGQMRDSLQWSRRRFRIFGSQRDTHESRHEARFLAKQLVQTETDLRQARAEAAYLQQNRGTSGTKIAELKARIRGLENAFEALTTARGGNLINYETYTAGTDIVAGLEAQFVGLQQEFIKARKSYINARLALEGNVSSIYVVQKAVPAIRKARPIRWLIVAGSTFLAFLLAVVLIMVLEEKGRKRASGGL